MALKVYRAKATSDFWDDHWEKDSLNALYNNVFNHTYLIAKLLKYLPKNGKILEGGCGTGQYVYAFKKLGYDITGIDYAEKTINRIKAYMPEMPVRVGDVFKLSFGDSELNGYISLGVVEHYEGGPQDIIKEIERVLRKEGILFLTVPYYNPFRRLKNLFKLYPCLPPDGKEFYQYLFTDKDIKRYLMEGFNIVKVFHFSGSKGLSDEIRFLRSLIVSFQKKTFEGLSGNGKKLNQLLLHSEEQPSGIVKRQNVLSRCLKRLANSEMICRYIGHMVMVIAERK